MAAAVVTPAGIADNIRRRIQGTLDSLSISDFAHDFGSTYLYSLLNNVSLSTKLSNEQRARIVGKIIDEIAKKVKTTPRAKSATWNLYNHFHDDLREAVFPGGIRNEILYHEAPSVDSVLNGVTLQQIKNHFFPTIGKGVTALRTIRDIKIKSHEAGQVNRSYTVNAVKFKYGNASQYNRTLSEVFRELTGVNKVGIMEDASTIPMSELSTVERFDDAQTADFTYYIIKSVENESDSANKVNKYWGDTDKVKKIFLKDADSGNTYPSFSDGVGNNAAVYTNLKFNTWRNKNGEIDGTYHFPTDEKVEIYNLSESSKIAKTALKVIETYIDNYNDYAAGSPTAKLKTCLYFPVKKFGDWCQALCLLDTSRKYKQMDQNDKNIAGEITLSEVANDGTVGVLTGDQILLAYSLLIGVNVFFTVKVRPLSEAVRPITVATEPAAVIKAKGKKYTKAAKPAKVADDDEHSDHWLFYFKNNSSDEAVVDDAAALIVILDRLLISLQADVVRMTPIVEASKTPSGRIGPNGKLIVNPHRIVENEIIGYIDDLRTKGRIHSSNPLEKIETLATEVRNMQSKLRGAGPHKKREFRVDLLETRVGELIIQNETLSAGLSDEESQTTSEVVELIFSDTILSDTTKFQRFLSTILYPIRDDFKGSDNRISRIVSFVEENNALLAGRVAGRASRVKVSNHKKFVNTLNDVFSNFLPAAGGTKFATKWEKQKTDLKEAFDKIRLRSILVFNTAQAEAAQAVAAQAEAAQAVAAQAVAAQAVAAQAVAAQAVAAAAPAVAAQAAAAQARAEAVQAVAVQLKFNNNGPAEDPPEPHREDTKYYIMPIGEYVIDRNGNYCSVLDKYIVTLDECDTFISARNDACAVIEKSKLQGLTAAQKKSINEFRVKLAEDENGDYLMMTDYLYYRFILLRTDILYTRYKVLELEPNDREIGILIDNTLTLINNVEKEEGAKVIQPQSASLRSPDRVATLAAKRLFKAEEELAILQRIQAARGITREEEIARDIKAAKAAASAEAAELAIKQFMIAKLNYVKGLLADVRRLVFSGYASLEPSVTAYETREQVEDDVGIDEAKRLQSIDTSVAKANTEGILSKKESIVIGENASQKGGISSVMGGRRRRKTRRGSKKSKNRYTRHLRHA
jgi:hypothetical protein